MKKYLVLFTFAAAFIGCSDNSTRPVAEFDGPPIQLVSMGQGIGLAKIGDIATQVDSIMPSAIFIDTLFKSRITQYLVQATSAPITDLTITSSDPDWEVSPGYIPILYPADGGQGIAPVLQVHTRHGQSLYDGTYKALPAGLNQATITFSGTVNDTAFSVTYDMAVFAYVTGIFYVPTSGYVNSGNCTATIRDGELAGTAFSPGDTVSTDAGFLADPRCSTGMPGSVITYGENDLYCGYNMTNCVD